MPNIAGVIGLGQAKPKNYENLAMQQLAQANAARVKKAKYDKELADKWGKDLMLKADDMKGLFPAQIEALKNISTRALEDFQQARLNNPNSYTVAANEIYNELRGDIATMKEQATKWNTDVFDRENLLPEQEDARNRLRNLLYGKDYGAVSNYMNQQDNEFGTVAFEPTSMSMILPDIMPMDNVTKAVSTRAKQQFDVLEQQISQGALGKEFEQFQITGVTPEAGVQAIAADMWANPAVQTSWLINKKRAGEIDKNATEEEIFSEFVEFVRPLTKKEVATQIRTRPDAAITQQELAELVVDEGRVLETVAIGGRDKDGKDTKLTGNVEIPMAVSFANQIQFNLQIGENVIDVETGKRLKGTGAKPAKTSTFFLAPVYTNELVKFGDFQVNNKGVLVPTTRLDRDKGKYNWEIMVEAIVDMGDQEFATVRLPLEEVGTGAFYDEATQSEKKMLPNTIKNFQEEKNLRNNDLNQKQQPSDTEKEGSSYEGKIFKFGGQSMTYEEFVVFLKDKDLDGTDQDIKDVIETNDQLTVE